MAEYNACAINSVYDASGDLSESGLMHDFGAFLGSVYGALGHLITAERIRIYWFTREDILPSALNERPKERSLTCGMLGKWKTNATLSI